MSSDGPGIGSIELASGKVFSKRLRGDSLQTARRMLSMRNELMRGMVQLQQQMETDCAALRDRHMGQIQSEWYLLLAAEGFTPEDIELFVLDVDYLEEHDLAFLVRKPERSDQPVPTATN